MTCFLEWYIKIVKKDDFDFIGYNMIKDQYILFIF